MGKVIEFEQLASVRDWHPGQKISHAHGVFDLFHFGHLAYLRSAKKYGDVLVVTVTPDRFVNKGPGRPRYTEQQRAAMLAALEVVDYVAINHHPKAVEPIRSLQPHYYIKGPDYRNKQADITGGIFEEEDAVRSVGGELVFTDDDTESSTELLNQYFSQWNEEQKVAIDRVKRAASLESIVQTIESLAKLRVLVIGEPIVDTYVFCTAEGISTKSPTVSARYLYQEDYAGGSLAIANHLAALGCDVGLLFTHGNEPYFKTLLENSLHQKVRLFDIEAPGVPTPRKTRFMIPFRAQRIFELIDLRADQWKHIDSGAFLKKLADVAPDYDVVILADFGHGLFEAPVLEAMSDLKNFVALNVQTNSGNFGFNLVTKHKRFDYVSLDERETRLASRDRFTPPVALATEMVQGSLRSRASITLGTAGSLYFDANGEKSSCPAFFTNVVDTTGAGDAYFAITSLLVKLGAPSQVVPFIGNCYAGLKTQIIGNKSAVGKVELIKTVQSILK